MLQSLGFTVNDEVTTKLYLHLQEDHLHLVPIMQRRWRNLCIIWPILTKFGNLTLAELECYQIMRLRELAMALVTLLVWCWYRSSTYKDTITIHFSVATCNEKEEDYEKRITEIQYKASIYEMLRRHRGSTIPRFLCRNNSTNGRCVMVRWFCICHNVWRRIVGFKGSFWQKLASEIQ